MSVPPPHAFSFPQPPTPLPGRNLDTIAATRLDPASASEPKKRVQVCLVFDVVICAHRARLSVVLCPRLRLSYVLRFPSRIAEAEAYE